MSKFEQNHIKLLAREFAICDAFHEIEPDAPLIVRIQAIALAEQELTGPQLQRLRDYRAEISLASLRIVK